jgi:hypothetical protein
MQSQWEKELGETGIMLFGKDGERSEEDNLFFIFGTYIVGECCCDDGFA